jgi:hypothetical protein
MRQSIDLRGGERRRRSCNRLFDAQQSVEVKSLREIADVVFRVVRWTQIGLAELLLAERTSLLLVRQRGERRQTEQLVDELDDRPVLAVLMRDRAGRGVGRDQDGRNARACRQDRAVGKSAAALGGDVIVEASVSS